jgi:hypothetical protein
MKKVGMVMAFWFVLGTLLSTFQTGVYAKQSATKEPYKIGLTSALTGPPAPGFVGIAEGFRIYLDKLNQEGGIDGHPVKIVSEDDRGVGTTAASNVRKFSQLGVSMVVANSVTAIYPGVIGELEKGNIPGMFACGSPREAHPPKPHPLVFGCGHGGPAQILMGILRSVSASASGKPVKFGALAADLPAARIGADLTAKAANRMGMETVVKVIPLAIADLTPIASSFIEAKINYLSYYGPGGIGDLLGDAMYKLGWKGIYIVNFVAQPFERTMLRWKRRENVFGYTVSEPTILKLKAHREISEAGEKFKITMPVDNLVVRGWWVAKTLEEILKKAGWPATTDKLVSVMNSLYLDRRPLLAPLNWSAQDHTGNVWYAYYRWDGGRLVPALKNHWIGVGATRRIAGEVSSLRDIKSE